MVELSRAQRRIVECPYQGCHLLVLAGPGSGKTRTVVERVGQLLREGCPAERVLVMTFTLKAAEELRDRLAKQGRAGVWAGTFHHVCARLLTDHGAAIGIRPPLRIYDEPKQRDAIERAAKEAAFVFDKRGALTFQAARDHISRRKCAGLRAGEWRGDWGKSPVADQLMLIDEAHHRFMGAAGALDYDDLLVAAIRLVREDDETATLLRRRFGFILVDEFHDVSPEQYELIRALAPPENPSPPYPPPRGYPVPSEGEGCHADDREASQVMVVADQNQAIFGWRGADPLKMLDRYRRDYRPVEFRMEENFRSTPTIVRAAAALLDGKIGATLPLPLLADGNPVFCFGYRDVEHEAERLAGLIKRAVATGKYGYDDVAVLYRAHERADAAEQALLRHGIPIRRVKRERFFNQPDVQETLRYLDLVASLSDPSFEPALNWPRVVVDELTMIHLRRVAEEEGLTLAELAARIGEFRDRVSPLTRVAVEEFCVSIADELTPLTERSVDEIVERLLALLARRRRPFPDAERETMRGVLEFLGGPMVEPLEALRGAMQERRAIAVRYGPGLDRAAAAVIVERVLGRYLGRSERARPWDVAVPAGAFVVMLGKASPVDRDGFGIGIRQTREMRYSVATQAWRLGQMLLMAEERLDEGRVVVYDLETGSYHANTTEIVEVAALRVENRVVQDEPFQRLVRPGGRESITYEALRTHGIRWIDVAKEAGPDEVLPELMSFLGDDILVGHNVEEFDGRVLARVAREQGLTAPRNPVVDSCLLARRLLPGESHALADLAARFGVTGRQTHRALGDCRMAAAVFGHLLALQRAEHELDALGEALPIVAMSMRDADVPLVDENATLILAGARAHWMGQGEESLRRLSELIDDTDGANEAMGWLREQNHAAPEDDARWEEFNRRWRETAAQYVATAESATLPSFLHHAALAAAVDEEIDGDGRVTMMAIHSAKGKEWPLVFVIGLEEGVLPDFRSDSAEKLDEERRVFYVGLTRAKQQLCLLWAAWSRGRDREPSRFLRDLPPELVEHRRFDDAPAAMATSSVGQ